MKRERTVPGRGHGYGPNRQAHLARIEKEPTNPDLLSEVGAILLRLGEGEKAVRWLHHALQASHDTHQPSMLLLLRYYESQGDTAQADDFRRVLEKLNGGKPLPADKALERGDAPLGQAKQ